MRVLHVIDPKDDAARQYVAMLCDAVGAAADMRLAAAGAPFPVGNSDGGFQPDIIHLHGLATVGEPSTRIVLTPHGTQADTQGAYVVVARSPLVQQRLKSACARVETVRNPLLTRTTSPKVCARQYLDIYQRVVDSDVLPLMNEATRGLLRVLLTVSVCGDRRWSEGHALPDAANVDFRRLFIYAEKEGVLPMVEEGLRLVGLEAPAHERTSGYLPDGYRLPIAREQGDLLGLLADIEHNGPSLLRLTEVERTLRAEGLDEKELMRTVKEAGMQNLLASVLQLTSEQTLLTEGFMPCQPADNQLTQQLRKQLRERLRVV